LASAPRHAIIAFTFPIIMKADGFQAEEMPVKDLRQSYAAFAETHWTTVLNAQGVSVPAQQALNRLCCKYWPPVYAFIRRKWTQHSREKAEDLTQTFFLEFIKKFPELEIGPEKGKFRTYLLACLTRFLCKDWERSSRPEQSVIPLAEFEETKAIDALTSVAECTPERAYDIVWANTLAQKTLASLSDEYRRGGKTELCARLLPLLTGRSAHGAYSALATELNMSEGGLRVAMHQFRRRFGQLLRAEVAETVPRAEDAEEELRYLLSLWGTHSPSASTGD
jgi:RNA polymerase sigma-70 factor (ECF subfamily)